MARLVRGRPRARSQQESAEEPERDPQQDEQPDTAEGKDIVDYALNIAYEGSQPKNEQVAQEQSEVDLDAEYEKMEWPNMEDSNIK